MFDDGSFRKSGCSWCVDVEQLVFESNGVLNILVDLRAGRGRECLIKIERSGNGTGLAGKAGAKRWEPWWAILNCLDYFVKTLKQSKGKKIKIVNIKKVLPLTILLI